ncbi:beta strand repeat-containing protein [Adhaeretor mobilis]|uniref:Putative outer membrane protein pmp20 n=1 Tax=Adhaeretor mobilis TaxID=1930276 RepID=A0A517MYP4_9BACT|nr:DVUA0089 family protein [Adhaeretor mobilis]QDT00006.1 putative outer membrane protein pmp20 precursor [Adhaeretor mobilis]
MSKHRSHKSRRVRKTQSATHRRLVGFETLEPRRLLACTNPGPDGDTNDQICEPIATLGNGQTITAAIGGPQGLTDVDLYKISISSSLVGKEITFTANATPGSSLDTYLRLFDDNGVELEDDEDGGPGVNSLIDFTFTSSGTYYLGVSSSSNEQYSVVTGEGDDTGNFSSEGPYEVTFEDTNDQIDEASDALLDGFSGGNSINLVTDVDLFRWEGIDGQSIRFEVDGDFVDSTTGLDTYLRLFDNDGNQLDFNDDGGGNRDSELTFTFGDTDDFFLGVSSFGNTSYDAEEGTGDTEGSSTGSYSITATEVSLDSNDRISNAVDLGDLFTVGTVFNGGEIDSAADVDLYKFQVGRAGSFVEIDVDRPTGGVDSLLRLFDANGVQIAANDDANAPGETGALPRDSFLGMSLAPGIYYAGVSAYQNSSYDINTGLGDTDGNSTGSYTIDIQDRLHVDSTGDTNTGTLAANDNHNMLREAIAFANDTAGSQTITFQPSVFASGGTITLSVPGTNQLEITDSVVINGLGANLVTVSGNDNSRVFLIDNGNDNTEIAVTLRDLTIRDGNTAPGPSNIVDGEEGAGIRNTENLTLDGVAVTSNTTLRAGATIPERDGGGIFHSIGTLLITDSTFSDNSAENGAAIAVSSGSVTIDNSTIRDNSANVDGGGILVTSGTVNVTGGSLIELNTASDDGGGIFASTGTLVNIDGSTVSGNEADDKGGGIVVTGATLTVTGGSLVGGDADAILPLESNKAGVNGGGIFADASSVVTIDGSRVSGNIADTDGGGIYVTGGTVNVMSGSSIELNTASDDGGGIFASTGTLVNIDGSTVSGNEADDKGGGIVVTGATLNITGGSVVGGDASVVIPRESNKAGVNGGGIFADASSVVTIDNSTVSGNIADDKGGGVFISGGTLDVQNGSTLGGDTEAERNKAMDSGGAIFAQSGAVVTIDASTVSGNIADASGGGIFMISGTLNIQNGSTLGGDTEAERNKAMDSGGAIFAQSGAVVTIDASTVSGNIADASGGGIFMISGTLNIQNGSTLGGDTEAERNKAMDDGGAIFAQSGAVVTIDASTVSGNIADTDGGGIVMISGTLNIQNGSTLGGDTALEANHAVGNGGAIFAQGGSVVTIDASTVSGNIADTNGGGITMLAGTLNIQNGSTLGGDTALEANQGNLGAAIFAQLTTVITIDRSTIAGNKARVAGGGLYRLESTGSTTIINSTFSGNLAEGDTGGLRVISGPTVIRNSTFTGNRADSDGNGAGFNGGINAPVAQLTMHNTIVAGNFKGTGTTPSDMGTEALFNDFSHNLIGSADVESGSIFHGINGNIVGVNGGGTIPITTILNTTLADNGGPTLTHALVPGSLAINRGSNAEIAAGVTTDQRGEARIKFGTVDIGAFESDFDVTSVASADFNEDNSVDGFDFLAWQLGFGTSNPALADGDANDDGSVDAVDLGIWQTDYGTVFSGVATGITSVAAASSAPPVSTLQANRAALVDAALATVWLGAETEDEAAVLEGTGAFGELIPASRFRTARLAPTAIAAGEREPFESEAEEGTESAWLSDELLERVFG